MAYTSYPFDNQDTTESQYSALFRELQDSGCIGDGKGGCNVTANASAMSVIMSAGNAIVRGHYFTNDAVVTLPIGAASGSIRYDAVVLQLDPATNAITPVVKANTGQAPALTQTDTGIFELLLAVVTVPAGAVTISAANVTDRRSYVGGRVGLWDNSTRPTGPRNYRTGFNTDLGGRIEVFEPANGWMTRQPYYWGTTSGTVLPTAGMQNGDTWRHAGTGTMYIYNTTYAQPWRRVGNRAILVASAMSMGAGSNLAPGATGATITTTINVPAHDPGILHISGHLMLTGLNVNAGLVQAFIGPTSTTMSPVGERSRYHNNGNVPTWTVPCDGYIESDGTAKVAAFLGWSDPNSGGTVSSMAASMRVYLL